MGRASRHIPERWVGRKVEVAIRGDSTTTTGEVIGVDKRGVQLVEEVYPEPYGDGMLEDMDGRFYPHDFIAQARLS